MTLGTSRESTQKHNKKVFLTPVKKEPIEGSVIVDDLGNQMGIAGNHLYTRDLGLEIARGIISGTKEYIIVGRKDSLSNTVFDDYTQIPNTRIVPIAGGIQLELVSSSTNDTSDGSGARIVKIEYLDTTGAEQAEEVILNGTIPVNTVATDIDHVQWMHILTVGDGEVSAGNLSLRDTAGSVTYEYIKAGGNQSLSGRFTVPTGKTGYITGWQASGITKIIDVRLRATVDRFTRSLIPAFNFQDVLLLNNATSGHIPFTRPLKCPAGAKIKISGMGKATTGDGAGNFSILLIDD